MSRHVPSVQEIIEQNMEEEKLYDASEYNVPHRSIRGDK